MTETNIYLDDWEIIKTTTLLITEKQEAKIILTPEDPLIVRVRFESTPAASGEKPKSKLSVSGEGNDGVLTFSDWNSALGAANQEPLEFAGDDQGRQIAVMCSVWKIGACHQAFLQFMRREKK
jgi:hypothetical protein